MTEHSSPPNPAGRRERLNPIERTLEVLRLCDGAWTIVVVLTGREPVRAEPFDAVALELAGLWAEAPAKE